MRKLHKPCLLILSTIVGLFSSIVFADEPTTIYGADYVQSVLPYKSTGRISEIPVSRAWLPGDPIKEIPKRRKPPKVPVAPKADILKLDPLLTIQQSVGRASQRSFTTPSYNFNGQGFSGVNPPDTVGDVGRDYYIQMINGSNGSNIVFYNKSDGTVAAGPIRLGSLATGNCALGRGDPIVLYDELADRWMISEFINVVNGLCIYISATSNPLGSYWIYEFSTGNFPDYPKYSAWPDAYYVTSNEGGGAPIYALDRINMLAGSPASLQRMAAPVLSGFGFQALTPADIDGFYSPPTDAPGYFMRHRDDESHNVGSNNVNQDFLEIWEFDVDFATPGNTTLTGPTNIPIAEFDSDLCGLSSFECFPQPNTNVVLDPLREVIMWRLQYRKFGSHESLVGNFVTDVNGSNRGGIRWFELRKIPGGWGLHQEGTYSPDSVNRWMGSIAMDGSGNIAIGYNASNASISPSLRYTGRLSSDTLGIMTQTETTLIAGSASNASIRYGDYSAMSVDPFDSCTFWMTGEYNAAATWTTRIAAFRIDSCQVTDKTCTGVTVNLTNRSFSTDTVCLGGTSISTGLATTVESGTELDFISPAIHLGPGFSVAQGATFRARN